MVGAIAVPVAAHLHGTPVLATSVGVGVLGAIMQRLAWRMRRDREDRIFYVSTTERVMYYLSNAIFCTFVAYAFFGVFSLITGMSG